jgi:[ribosomal protein S5]-alanine N-acetyltransferase
MALQPTLETKRLILRPFTLQDAPVVHELVSAREIADTTLAIPHPYEQGMAEAWIGSHQKGYDEGNSVHFAITVRESSQLVGSIGLQIHPIHSYAEMGYWVGVPYWGNGYCTEAVGAVIKYGFEDKGLNRIYAVHFKRNPASGRVMQKNGMVYEGCLHQHVRKWDGYEDLMQYGILQTEWREMMEAGRSGRDCFKFGKCQQKCHLDHCYCLV